MRGCGLGLAFALVGMGLNYLILALLFPRGDFEMFAVLFFGIGQLVYAVPMLIHLLLRGHRDTAKGLAIVAGVGLLLNSLCTAAVMTSFSGF